MIDIYGSVRQLRGVGEKSEQLLQKLGVRCAADLLYLLPRRYYDLTDVSRIADAGDGDVVLRARIVTKPSLGRINRGLNIIKFRITDGSGSAQVSIFNQPYLLDKFTQGGEYLFYGRAQRDDYGLKLVNPSAEAGVPAHPILPVYPLTSGLSQRAVMKLIEQAIDSADGFTEMLSADFRRSHDLAGISEAIRGVHLPSSAEALRRARYRLLFEELLLFSSAVCSMQTSGEAPVLPPCRSFVDTLPFAPTKAQLRVIDEIDADLSRGRAATRLIQGDVGCGKTVVAFYAMYCAAKAGTLAAMLAPTDILARQHFETAKRLIPGDVGVVLVTGSQTAAERAAAMAAIDDGSARIVIGTHALLFGKLAQAGYSLVVTDEQHRFGVRQRQALTGSGTHTLIMSATPIPRTLAMFIYGGWDISVIDEQPVGREHVKTRIVPEKKRVSMYGFVREAALAGKSAFVVCPSVAASELPMRSAEDTANEVQKLMDDVPVALVHGRMSAAQKAQAMDDFASGRVRVLVATTVIEVGIDVPDAQIMVVENAERFGLATLHQLRGRVGRRGGEAWCFLVSDYETERLSVLTQTGDGFEIARRDLELRGPGEFMGAAQNGVADLYMRSLMTDMRVFERARAAYDGADAAQRAAIDREATARFGDDFSY